MRDPLSSRRMRDAIHGGNRLTIQHQIAEQNRRVADNPHVIRHPSLPPILAQGWRDDRQDWRDSRPRPTPGNAGGFLAQIMAWLAARPRRGG